MADPLLKSYREQFPTDARSDEELTLLIGEQLSPAALAAHPSFAKEYNDLRLNLRRANSPSLPAELGRAVGAGVDTVQAKLYDTAGLAGDIVGSETLSRFGSEGYQRNMAEAAANAPTIESIQDVQGVEDLARYTLGLAGSQAPQMAATLGGAVVGGALTGGNPLGMLAGAGAMGFSQMQNRGELLSSPGVDRSSVVPTAIGVGALGAILEAWVPLKVTSKILKGVPDEVAKKYFAQVVKEVPVNVLEEGGTEVLQELTAMAGESYANRNNPDFQLTREQIYNRLINAGVAGAILGGGTGLIPGRAAVSPNDPNIPKPAGSGDEPTEEQSAGVTPGVATIAPGTIAQTRAGDYTDRLDEGLTNARQRAAAYGDPSYEDFLEEVTRSEQEVLPPPASIPESVQVLGVGSSVGPTPVPVSPLAAEVQSAAAETDTNPTEAQKETGNYKKGHVNIQGLDVTIENPVGSQRSGVDRDGKPWSVTMPATYGYVRGTEGKDGDHVDVYVGPNPELANVYVVDQVDADSRRFDEHKVMLGFQTPEAALAAYDGAFSDGKGPDRRSDMTVTTIGTFKNWLTEGDTTKPFAKQEVAKKVEPPKRAVTFNLEEVDFEGTALSDIFTKKGRATDEEIEDQAQPELPGTRMEDAFFELNAQRFSPDLGERLTSFAKGDQGNKSDTRRVTFFEDIETGQVIGLPTYYTSDKARGGKIYRVAALPGESKGTTLERLMQGGRYFPVASIRRKSPVSATDAKNVIVFDDALEFEKAVIELARAKMRKTASYAVEMPKKMQQQGFTEEGETVEFGSGVEEEEDHRLVVADALIEMLPKESVSGRTTFRRDLTPNTIAETLIQASAKPEFSGAVMRMLGEKLGEVRSDQDEFGRFSLLSVPDQQQYLLTKIANEVYDGIRLDETAPISTRVLKGVRADDQGTALYSTPRPGQGRATRSEFQGRFNKIVERLREQGFTVDVLKAIEKEMGKFNDRQRLVVLSLFDSDSPSVENIRLVLHESAHALFAQLPTEFQEVLRQSINQLSDDQAGLFNSTDPRIRQSNPAGLSQRVLSEERLVEYLAMRGVQRPVAQGVVADLFRFVKDLYFRLGLAIQKLLGRKPSTDLALSFAENRLAAFEAGTSLAPLMNWVVPPQGELSPNVNRYTLSEPERIGEKTETSVVVESKVAALNEVLAFENSIASMLQAIPGVNALAAQAGGLMTWWRDTMRFSDVLELKAAQLLRTAPNGTPLPVRPDIRIDQFQADQNVALASLDAYKLVQERYSKLVAAGVKTRVAVEDGEMIRTGLAEEIKALAQDYTNVQGATARMTRGFASMIRRVGEEIKNSALELGAISQQLVALGETRETIRLYEPVFKKLFPPKELHGEKLFDFLDAMANDSRIDFSRPIAEIRQVMIDSRDARYEPLTQPNRESRARLATAVAFAKRNELVMLGLELRKMQDLGRRAKINDALKASLQDAKDLGEALVDLPRTAIMEDRLAMALKKKKRQAKKVLEQLQAQKAKLGAIEAVTDQYRQKMRELGGKNQVHAPTFVGDGMEYWVPTRADGKSLGDGIETRILRVDSRNQITDVKTLDDHLGKMAEWLDTTTDRDSVYYQVEAQYRELMAYRFGEDIIQSHRGMLQLVMSDLGTQMGAFGTPTARVLEQMLMRFATVERFNQDKVVTLSKAYERARNHAVKVLGSTPEFYKDNFYDKAMAYLEQRRDIVEKYPNDQGKQLTEAFAALIPQLRKDHAATLAGKEDKFFAALKAHIEAAREASTWFSDRDAELGGGVKDDKLRVETKRGDFVSGIRSRIDRGVVTVPRVTSQALHRIFKAMVDKSWSTANFSGLAETYNQMGEDQARHEAQKYFAHPEIQWFVRELAEMRPISAFNAPILLDGVTRPEGNPSLVSQAWEQSGGDIVAFAENLYTLHGGQSDRGQYVQEVVSRVHGYFREMKSAQERQDPNGMNVGKDFNSMVSTFMFHSRQIEHWPASMFSYAEFDRHSSHRMNQKVAAQTAFGPEQERLSGIYETLVKEVASGVEKLNNAQSKVEGAEPDGKKLEAALEKEVGGKEELKRLRKLKELQRRLPKIKEGLIEYFRGAYSTLVPERFIHQLTSTLAGAIVNQPATALGQFVETFSPIFAYGVSPASMKLSLRTLASAGKELAGGLVEAFGAHFDRVGKYRQMWLDYGQGDPAATLKLVDAIATQPTPYTGNGYIDRGLRAMTLALQKVQAAQSVGLGKKDGQQKFTVPRLLAPFVTVSRALHAGVTQNLWRMTDEYVSRALEVQNSRGNSWALGPETTTAEWAKALGYKGQSAFTFVNFFDRLKNEVGRDFHSLVQEGARGRKGSRDTLLRKETYESLMMFGIREMTTETNIATMPVQVFNNWALKTALPLNGWAIRRATKITDTLQYDADGRRSLQALTQGLLALTVLAGGGLAVSMLVDLYNEELLKKKRNLRRLNLEGGPENLALGILEHSTRIGTFGFFGEIFNAAVNVSTGQGDNRGVSIDGRVIFVNSLAGLLRSTSSFINQGFEADYANVIRPALFSVGGNGALQYMQLANGLFDFDNQEARATARTNVGNWLRVIGRELGMEVRKLGAGGYSTATPVTPHVTRMVLAAYGNNMEDFNRAHREAIKVAKDAGQDDPAEYVQRSFASRHPLKSIFRFTPSESEYRKILSALPEDGRRDVVEAVNLFNRFSVRLGGTPFDGKEAKKATASTRTTQPFDLNSVRARAALFGAGY